MHVRVGIRTNQRLTIGPRVDEWTSMFLRLGDLCSGGSQRRKRRPQFRRVDDGQGSVRQQQPTGHRAVAVGAGGDDRGAAGLRR